jgi:hypothetical protein
MGRRFMRAWLVTAAVCTMLATARDAVASPWSSAGSLVSVAIVLGDTVRVPLKLSKRSRRLARRGPVRITAAASGHRLTRAVTVKKRRSSR